LARNQKKSGGQDRNRNRSQNRRQDGAQSPGSQQEPKRSGNDQGNWTEDEFDGVLPSYGSFLKDMQYENDWGDDWDDDDTPIEKKVAAQKAEKAKAQKKKKQSTTQPVAREKSPAAQENLPVAQEKQRNQDKKQQAGKQSQKATPPVHEDENLFNNEDDRGLTLEEIDTSSKLKVQSAKSTDKQKAGSRPPSDCDVRQGNSDRSVPDKKKTQKQESKGKAAKSAPVAKNAVPEPVAAPETPVETAVPVEAVSKGGGVSLRVVATKSVMPSSSRRKRAERGTQNEESKEQRAKC
jgi:hypothetical protein